MNLGVRAHDRAKAPIEEVVKDISDVGFGCAHIALKKSITEFPVDNNALTPGLAMHLKRIFAKNDVDIAVLGCYLNICNPDKEQLEKIFETYKANIKFASILGCGVVGTETGAVNTEYKFEPANHTEEAFQVALASIKRIVSYAEKMGVIFAIEPVYRHVIYSVEQAKRVLDEIDSPNLQIIFDPVNVLSIDNYKNQDEILRKGFELFGDRLAVVHAKDFIIENNDIKSVPAGKGMLNYELLMSLIKKNKPYIHVTLEDTVPENAMESKKYVEDIYKRV